MVGYCVGVLLFTFFHAQAAEPQFSGERRVAELIAEHGDTATARARAHWNMAAFLPPKIQERFVEMTKCIACQPWLSAAAEALSAGKPAPSLDQVHTHI